MNFFTQWEMSILIQAKKVPGSCIFDAPVTLTWIRLSSIRGILLLVLVSMATK